MSPLRALEQLWSTTRFRAKDLSSYAERLMLDETRSGVRTMSLVFLVPVLASILVSGQLGLDRSYVYTCAAIAALAVHVYFSARAIHEIRTLHVLGMTLLIVSGTAFVLLAHRTGAFGAALFSSVVLLFMVIPMVPWGLREASITTLLIYGVFSSSTWSAADRFETSTLWTLQTFMLGAAIVSLTLVARGARVRKQDIRARYELEDAHRHMHRLSLQDPLTGAWNRRHLEAEFSPWLERAAKLEELLHLGLIDVNRFKQLNDRCGHAYGDEVLRWVVDAFATAVDDHGFVARIGGDEFALVLIGDEPEVCLEQAVRRLHESALAHGQAGRPTISLSLGLVTMHPGPEPRLDDAYRAADNALYEAKRRSRTSRGPIHLVRVTLRDAEPGGAPCS